LTKHTSDNQRLGCSNDTTSVAQHPHWIEVQAIRWPVFRVRKLRYVKDWKCSVTWTMRWQQLCHLTSPRLQRIF